MSLPSCGKLLLPLLLLLARPALAQEYRVETAGGPLTLPEEVADAATAWQEAVPGISFTEVDDAADLIVFGDPGRMGPDLVSATVVPEDDGLEVRLNPAAYREFPAALVHELGLLLGVPVGGEGVMSPLLGEGRPSEPTTEDVAALEQVRERVTGDLDGDGEVGLDDLAALGRAYGDRGVNLAADLDGDGVVGADDLEILRAEYEFEAPSQPAPAAPGEGDAQEAEPEAAESGQAQPEDVDIDEAGTGETDADEIEPDEADPDEGSGTVDDGREQE